MTSSRVGDKSIKRRGRGGGVLFRSRKSPLNIEGVDVELSAEEIDSAVWELREG